MTNRLCQPPKVCPKGQEVWGNCQVVCAKGQLALIDDQSRLFARKRPKTHTFYVLWAITFVPKSQSFVPSTQSVSQGSTSMRKPSDRLCQRSVSFSRRSKSLFRPKKTKNTHILRSKGYNVCAKGQIVCAINQRDCATVPPFAPQVRSLVPKVS